MPKKSPTTRAAATRTKRAKTTTPKKSVRRATRKTTKKSATHTKRQKKSVDSVALPKEMSQRSIKKSRALHQELDTILRDAMLRISYVAGLCFVLIGATLAAVHTFSVSGNQAASVNEVVSEAADSAAAVLETEFEFLDDIPAYLTTEENIKFTATNADLVRAYVREKNAQSFGIEQTVTTLSDDTYRAKLQGDRLSAGYYELWVYVRPADGSQTTAYQSDVFFAGTEAMEEAFFGSADEAEDEEGESNSGNDAAGTNSDDEPAESESSIVSIGPVSDETVTGTITIPVQAPAAVTYLELYARPLNSLEPRFVTLATERFQRWQFVVDTSNLPNGAYTFFAETTLQGETVNTAPLRLTIENDALSVPQSAVISMSEAADDDDESANTGAHDVRNIITISNTEPDENEPEAADTPDSPVTPVDDIERETDDLLAENADTLDELLQNYAAAQQSGNDLLIAEAAAALERARQEIANETLNDDRTRDIADSIDTALTERVANLQQRIRTFEDLRRERSAGDSAIDTDGDGISDIDEIQLYGTDPLAADSDNDGIPDGVEIVRGFNPTDPTPEAIIEFESPKDSIGLTRDDVLTIAEVIPVVQETADQGSIVKTEIRGQALPNTYVTLYIFSSPTVVTVRTDADGAFVYTYERELADGRHDVYVAITDNAGDIIAQSNPFPFVKEAEAFTPVDAEAAEVVSAAPVTDTGSNTYNVVAGVGLLALGVILLMLGVSLRGKHDDESTAVTTDTNPVGNTKTPNEPDSAGTERHSDTT